VASVAWLHVAPVKGLALVERDEIALGPDGVEENRRFCLVDADGRRYGALRDGRLQAVRPRWDPDGRVLALAFPDGSVVEDELRLDGGGDTDLYDRRVPVRFVAGPWGAALSAYAGRPLRLVLADRPNGSVDRERGPVTLVSRASVDELARKAGVRSVDPRRFRMLIGLDGCAAHEEDEWIGRSVQIGEAVVRPLEQVARCAITTQDPGTGTVDFDTLRELIGYRGLRDGRHADMGVYGEVVQPGHVRVGDRVEPLRNG
jgi:uncharacterized protein YcbX